MSGGIGAASAGRDLSASIYSAPSVLGGERMLERLFGPSIDIAARAMAEGLAQKLSATDRTNASAHIDAVRRKVDDNERQSLFEREISTKKAEKLKSWIAEASGINAKEDALEAAAWRAVLEEIMTKQTDRMLTAVKALSRDDLAFLIEHKEKVLYDVPDNTIRAGIYKNSLNTRSTVFGLIIFGLALMMVAFFPTSLLLRIFDSGNRNFDASWDDLFAMSRFLIISMMITLIYLRLRLAMCYNITDLGERLLQKVVFYYAEIAGKDGQK